MSSTLVSKRLMVIEFFMYVLRNCKNIICLDADISDYCIRIYELLCPLKRITYVKNNYKSFKDTPTENVDGYDELLSKINENKDEYIFIFTDCKKILKRMKKDLKSKYDMKIDIYVGKSNSDDTFMDKCDINTDTSTFVLRKHAGASPVIIYGLDDNVNERVVFCYYTQGTIGPTMMKQQICRARKLKKLYYCFENRKVGYCKYNNYGECLKDVKRNNTFIQKWYCRMNESNSGIINNIYAMIEYQSLCYNSNKKGWLLKMLSDSGFIIESALDVCKHKGKDKEDKDNNILDIESKGVKEINKYLKIPEEKIKDYEELFTNEHKLRRHILFSNLLDKKFRGELRERIRESEEINSKLCETSIAKIEVLIQLIARYKVNYITSDKNEYMKVGKMLNDKENKIISKLFNTVYKRIGNKEIESEKDVIDCVVKASRNLFGGDLICVDSKSIRINNKVTCNKDYYINKDKVSFHKNLILYRKGPNFMFN